MWKIKKQTAYNYWNFCPPPQILNENTKRRKKRHRKMRGWTIVMKYSRLCPIINKQLNNKINTRVSKIHRARPHNILLACNLHWKIVCYFPICTLISIVWENASQCEVNTRELITFRWLFFFLSQYYYSLFSAKTVQSFSLLDPL